MALAEGLVVPKLTPDTVRVFVADDDQYKRDYVVDSLAEFGLADGIVAVGTYDEAEAFMSRQVPGQLEANVIVLDGELDETKPSGTAQGSRIASILFGKYRQPLEDLVDGVTETLKEGGLTRRQVDEIINPSGVHAIATQQLGKEALLVGISRTEALAYAQIPRVSTQDVGRVVFETVIPEPIRNKIAKQRRREADRARSHTNQAQ